MAAFRPVVIGLRDRNGDGVTNEADRSPEDQFGVEVVLLRWTGETVVFQTSSSSRYPVDRWVPIPDLKTERLPAGMSVAVPSYFSFGDNFGDDSWVSPPTSRCSHSTIKGKSLQSCSMEPEPLWKTTRIRQLLDRGLIGTTTAWFEPTVKIARRMHLVNIPFPEAPVTSTAKHASTMSHSLPCLLSWPSLTRTPLVLNCSPGKTSKTVSSLVREPTLPMFSVKARFCISIALAGW